MDLFEAILGRRSVRAYRTDPLPPEATAALKEAIRWAPSAGNLQARRFWFVTRPEVRRALGAATGQADLFATAPLVVVGGADDRIGAKYGDRGRALYAVQDVAAAVQNLLLAAYAHGLGTLWVGAFEPEKVQEALGMAKTLHPVVLVPVGRPAESPPPPGRLADDRLFVDVG